MLILHTFEGGPRTSVAREWSNTLYSFIFFIDQSTHESSFSGLVFTVDILLIDRSPQE
jgi:hypothetical protein